MGKFSSDRSVREYARDIWHVEPIDVAAVTATASTKTQP
jgi:hypothetical protein